MIATVLGLGIAIPLLFINAGVGIVVARVLRRLSMSRVRRCSRRTLAQGPR